MYKSLSLVLILTLAACSAPLPQAPPTNLPPTSTPAPSEMPGATATPPPVATSTPEVSLPQDMPQEYKDKLSEWNYTVENNMVSVDGEAWFQKTEAGEWQKVYYEQDGLRWTPSDLFGGRIKINPEKSGDCMINL